MIILPITQKSTHRCASLAGFRGIIWLTGITEMPGFLTCWDSESLLVMPHHGFRNASASEKLQIAVSNIYLQFFSHDRSKKALGNHSTRLGDGKLELFPGLSFIYLIFVKPHKHICVNFCPVWIFTELTQKILAFWQIYADKWHFYRFNTKGWRFLIQIHCFIMFYRVDSACLSCLCLCSSCFIMFIMLIYCAYHVEQSYPSESFSRWNFLGKEK